MNLLFIDLHCDALLPSGAGEFGGGNTYSRSVLDLISKNKEICCFYITRKKSKELKDHFYFSDNIRYFRIKIGEYNFNDKDSLYLYTEYTIKEISNLLTKENFVPDIIHSSYWPSGLVALEIGKNINAKQIHTVLSNGKRKSIESGSYAIEKIRTESEQNIYNNSDYIICSSKSEYNDINQLYSIPHNKLILTGLDVNDAFRFPAYFKDGSFSLTNIGNEKSYLNMANSTNNFNDNCKWWNDGSFLYFGRLHEDKGVLQIIQCWLELYKKLNDFPSLWIVGGTPEQIYEFRKKIKNLQDLEIVEKNGKLIWWGRLSSDGISTLLLKSLVVITHSRYEAGGLMILESMAAAKPVIATPNGFANDCIKNWRNGFIVNYNDTEQLKLRMMNFYCQPLLSSQLGNNARKTFLEIDKKYDFRNKHLSLYEIHSSTENNSKHINIIPYPLYELLPSKEEVLTIFYNIYSKNNLIDAKKMSIIATNDNISHLIWKININDKEFYCIRWKNHYDTNSVCFKNDNFHTSFEQYIENKGFLEENNYQEKYFDDANRLIFINSNKFTLKKLFNISEIEFSKYRVNKDVEKYTYENILNEIKQMLMIYNFLFKECGNYIKNAIKIIEKNYNQSSDFQLVAKNIDETYILGEELVFVNDLLLADKNIFNEKYRNRYLTCLIKCHKLMIKCILSGNVCIEEFSELLNELK